MTKPQHGSRRFAWTPVDGRERSLSESIDWFLDVGEDPRALAIDAARGHYLHVLSTHEPSVLAELAHLDLTEPGALDAWAVRWWACAPWALAWARETIRGKGYRWKVLSAFGRDASGDMVVTLKGGRYWCPPNDDTAGARIPVPELRRCRLTRAELAWMAPLKEPRHFDWLAAWQLGTDYPTIARRAHLGKPESGAEDVEPIVREACLRLADLIALPLRPAVRGRPPRTK